MESDTRRFMGWILAAGMGGMLLAHPVFFSRSRIYLFLIAATGWAWLWALFRQQRQERRLVPSSLVVWSAGFLALGAVLSVLFNTDVSWRNLWPLAAQLLFLWIGWWLASSPETVRILGGWLLGSASAAGLYAALQYYRLDPLPPGTRFGTWRVVSFFENPNHLGNFLACSLPVALAGFLKATGRSRFLFWGTIGLAYGGLLMAASRGAWWAGLAGCLVVAAGYARGIRQGQERFRPGALLALALLLAGVTLLLARRPVVQGPQGPVSVAERALSSRYILEPYVVVDSLQAGKGGIVLLDRTISHRFFIWRVTWRMIRAHPVFGWGYGTYPDRFARLWKEEQTGRRSQILNWRSWGEPPPYAHNEYLHIWAESGIVGLGGFLALVLLGGFKGASRAWKGGKEAIFLWGMLGLAAAMLVHSLVSYPLRLPLNGTVFWVAWGILLRRSCFSSSG